uniref:Lipoprotein n=1 Tax=Anguilla anguilla TaxID=7936 RepID=A0A0E9W7Y7_ANGAN
MNFLRVKVYNICILVVCSCYKIPQTSRVFVFKF